MLAATTGYLSYRHVTDLRWRQRAERAWRDYQVRHAERRLHDIASNTFTDMMTTARKASGDSEWPR